MQEFKPENIIESVTVTINNIVVDEWIVCDECGDFHQKDEDDCNFECILKKLRERPLRSGYMSVIEKEKE